ncbi:MAG: alpha/beta fold hydrolase, partial [Candidatus Limnocylindrales bacterium]
PARATRTTEHGEFVVPTSGTTARPKLARLPLDRLAASAEAWNAFLPSSTGWLLSLGLSHVAGLGIVSRAAAAGVPIVVPAGLDPAGMLDAIAAAARDGVDVSHLSLVAAQLAGLLDATGDAPPPPSIRAVILGGGPIPAALVRRAVAAGWPVLPSYGMTETASGIVALAAGEAGAHPGTVGLPLPVVQLRIADDGEIQVRGPMLFAGYLDDPDAMAATHTVDGWLRTGDLGRLDADGRLTVEGRADDLIVCGGENISPAEVETALASHPAIAEVAVIGAPDRTWGHVPVAIITVPPGITAPTDDDLVAHARARLARFKVPARFVRVASLPRTPLGKVQRRALPALIRPGDPPSMTRHDLTLADGQPIAVRIEDAADPTAPTAVLLHATLSSGGQLGSLARRLAERYRVVLIDRRGTADSPMVEPGRVPVARHVADVIEVLDALGIDRALLVGHSFGGVIALRLAAEHGDRVSGVVAWEPPYLPVAPAAVRDGMATLAGDLDSAFRDGGAESAARRFLEAVSGAGAWDRLHPRQREAIARQGAGALADASMSGLTADGLDAIAARTVIATGSTSEPFYRPIADALAERIGPAATREDLPGLAHMAPITDAAPIADLVLRLPIAPSAAHAQETPT